MNILDNQEVLERGIFGYRNYRHTKQEFFQEDFEDSETLCDFLDEMFNGESDITEIGKAFLLRMFQSDVMVRKIMAMECFNSSAFTTPEKFINAITRHSPHEISMFIARARENSLQRQNSNKKSIIISFLQKFFQPRNR